jgi:hypothetical protein
MRGTNEWSINKATMVEALQEYLDRRMVSAVAGHQKVVDVKNVDNYQWRVTVNAPVAEVSK